MGWDLVWRSICSWIDEGQCIAECARFQVYRLNKKSVFFWRDLWDFTTKDWRVLAHHKAFLSSDKLTVRYIIRLLASE